MASQWHHACPRVRGNAKKRRAQRRLSLRSSLLRVADSAPPCGFAGNPGQPVTAISLQEVVVFHCSCNSHRSRASISLSEVDVIVISIPGILAGADGPLAISGWANAQGQWLTRHLRLPKGVPSRDTIRRVLQSLKPWAFQHCFAAWLTSLQEEQSIVEHDQHDESLPQIALDGKCLRRPHARARGLGAMYVASAWATDQGIALAWSVDFLMRVLAGRTTWWRRTWAGWHVIFRGHWGVSREAIGKSGDTILVLCQLLSWGGGMPFRERPTSREPLHSTPILRPDKALASAEAFAETGRFFREYSIQFTFENLTPNHG